MSDFQEFQIEEGVYRVEDNDKLLIQYLGMGGAGLVAVFFLFSGEIGLALLGIALGSAAIWFFYKRAQTQKLGYTIDTVNNLLITPGGMKAKTLADEFSIQHTIQSMGMAQTSVPLDSIQSIKWEDHQEWRKGLLSDKHSWHYHYTIQVISTEGSLSFRFGGQIKRDELYTMLSQVLNMGEPIVNR